MTTDDLAVIRVAADDLKYLSTEWDESVDDNSLRRSSATLRLLLVEGVYGRAWRLAGFSKEPTVTATDLEANIDGFDRAEIGWALAGGGHSRGVTIAHALRLDRGMTAAEIKGRSERGPEPLQRTYGLSGFLNSICVIYRGVVITRRQLIQYVANKLGGTHLDAGRDPGKDREAIALDEALRAVLISGRPAVYFEILSIGQAVVKSGDANRFRSRAAEQSGRSS